MDEERIITSSMKEEDFDIENSLRPKSLDEYLGQDKSKEQLRIFIAVITRIDIKHIICRVRTFVKL